MASANIPETVLGVPLFVPSANNFFSIESGGLPNGEDCLKVLGATNRDYKAYQAAPNFGSPNDLFLTRMNSATPVGPDGVSISFWYKAGNVGAVTDGKAGILFGGMNASYGLNTNASAYFTSGGDGGCVNMSWYICEDHSGTGCKLRMFLPINTSGSTFANCIADVTITPDTWTLVTIAVNRNFAGPNLKIAANTAAYTNGTTSFTGNGLHGAIAASQFFCIGSYSDQSGMNGRDGDWYIGKLAFHDHELNLTERTLLYNVMT